VKPPRLETFGCRLNAYESEAMKGLATAAGLGDAVIVNTCAVTAEAVRQARQRIRRLRRDAPGARIVVTGCAAQTEPATFAAMPEVDRVLGNAEKLRPGAWRDLAADTAPRVAVGDVMDERRPLSPLIDGLGTRARAYVQVQNGCDHRCTFCIIPYGRGNSRSVPRHRGRAGGAPRRARLQRGGADRRRPHELGPDLTARRASATSCGACCAPCPTCRGSASARSTRSRPTRA
jgi:threonylcarbamoyladenosine tRNA methylthiotransferase MtaB